MQFQAALQKAFGQQGNVSGTRSQRRNAQGRHGNTVVQVHAETAVGHFLAQVAVRGGNQAEICLARGGFSQPIVFALLQQAQQLGLQVQRHFADLVEEQGASCGRFDLSVHPALARSGKRALSVTKELADKQLARQASAVERHIRPLIGMDASGKLLLANACLPQQEDCSPGAGKQLGPLDHLQHAGVFRQDMGKIFAGAGGRGRRRYGWCGIRNRGRLRQAGRHAPQ